MTCGVVALGGHRGHLEDVGTLGGGGTWGDSEDTVALEGAQWGYGGVVALGRGLGALGGRGDTVGQQHLWGVVAPWGAGTYGAQSGWATSAQATQSGFCCAAYGGTERGATVPMGATPHPAVPPTPLCPPPLCAPHPTHLRDADPRQRLHGAGQFCDHVEDLCWQPPHPDFPGAPGHHRDPTRPQQRLRHRLGHLTPKTVLLSSKFTPQQSPTPAGDPTAPSGTPRAAPSRSSHPKRPLIPL